METETDPDVSIGRTSRLISNFASKKNPVINGFFRNNRNPVDIVNIGTGVMNIPIDFVNTNMERFSELNFGGRQKVLFISNPSPTLVRKIHFFTANGWIILSDLNTWNGINYHDFTNGQLHLMASSNNVIVQDIRERASGKVNPSPSQT